MTAPAQERASQSRGSLRDRGLVVVSRGRAFPDVWTLLVVYALTRLFDAIVIARAARHQLPSIWTGPHSTYADLAQLWDGQWYKIIAEQSYPRQLPVGADGVVQQNPWAFFPGFPYTVRSVMGLTGTSFSITAVVVNVLLGACAVVVVRRVLQRVAGRRLAWCGAVLLCCIPSAPALQIAYSESLALLLLAMSADYLLSRRYLAATLAVLALALTRPVVAPFALVVLAHLVVRWWRSRRDPAAEPFPWRERAQVIGLGLLTAASSVLWPVVVGLVVGSSDAYERTQSAWRSQGVVQPFKQSITISHILWGDRGPTYLVLGSVAYAVLLLGPWAKPIGVELRAWCLAYPFYLLAVTEPWTSTFRYLLLIFPLPALLVGLVGRRLRLVVPVVLVLAVLGLRWQVHWVNELLVFDPPSDVPP